jgi:hypothetical protein
MRSRRLELCFVTCAAGWALVVSGCDSCSSPEDEQQGAEQETKVPATQPAAPVQLAPVAPAVVPLAPAPNPPGEAAYAHFDAAAQATHAVLAADLAGAGPHLAWLAHHEYPQRLPAAWRPHAASSQLAARVLARATTAGEAARGLPALHAACGACHQALSARDFDATEAPKAHADAALALLEGLSGRAESLFTSAAGLTPQIAGQPDAASLGALRKAAARAEAATTWVERTAATQEIYALCGTCHAALKEP